MAVRLWCVPESPWGAHTVPRGLGLPGRKGLWLVLTQPEFRNPRLEPCQYGGVGVSQELVRHTLTSDPPGPTGFISPCQ